MDQWIEQYQMQLSVTQEYIKEINEENNHYKIITNNQKALLKEIENLEAKLSLSATSMQLLTNPNFHHTQISKLNGALDELAQITGDTVHPRLLNMQAVRDKLETFGKLKAEFSEKFVSYMKEYFKSQVDSNKKAIVLLEAEGQKKSKDMLQEMSNYVPLLKWISLPAFTEIFDAFIPCLKSLSKRELRGFFETFIKSSSQKLEDKFRSYLNAFLSTLSNCIRLWDFIQQSDNQEQAENNENRTIKKVTYADLE